MDAYIYQAALYCDACGEWIRKELARSGRAPDPNNEYTYDSDDYPKGPFDNGGGEADCPQHCDACGTFLENPLTQEGYEHVRDAIEEDLELLVKDKHAEPSVALLEWAPFYGFRFTTESPEIEGCLRLQGESDA